MLDQYGIPFFYRQPMLVYEDDGRQIRRPDFTLPTYNSVVLEYAPRESSVPHAAHRGDVYKQNGIAAVFLQPSDLDSPHWQQRLYEQLERMYRQPLLQPKGARFCNPD